MNTLNTKSAKPLITDWCQLNWQRINLYVEKLQQRISSRTKLIQLLPDYLASILFKSRYFDGLLFCALFRDGA